MTVTMDNAEYEKEGGASSNGCSAGEMCVRCESALATVKVDFAGKLRDTPVHCEKCHELLAARSYREWA